VPTGWPPDGLRVASGWPRGGRNPPWSLFASVDTQPAHRNRGLHGIDPGCRLRSANIFGHFLRKAPFCWALSKRHSSLTPPASAGFPPRRAICNCKKPQERKKAPVTPKKCLPGAPGANGGHSSPGSFARGTKRRPARYSCSAPFATLCQTPQTSPTVVI